MVATAAAPPYAAKVTLRSASLSVQRQGGALAHDRLPVATAAARTKPCVWSRRCTKGNPFGSAAQPSCPQPRPASSAASSTRVSTAPEDAWVVTEFEPDVPWAASTTRSHAPQDTT